MTKANIIFGTFPIAESERPQDYLDILEKHGIFTLDTAFIYPNSEETLGKIGAPKKFAIHTKAPGFMPEYSLNKEGIDKGLSTSLERLQVDSVDTYFFHAPDRKTPLAESLEAVNEEYKAGKFKHFGISNYSPEEVEEIVKICKEKGYVLPTVYQGNYNAVARKSEKTLFPILRQHGIHFNAYSPLAGGFLSKNLEQITGNGDGRWEKGTLAGDMYRKLYARPTLLEGLKKWAELAKKAGTSNAALGYRWVVYNSILDGKLGDSVILGATRPAQLEQTLDALKEGPLPEDIVQGINEIWESVKDEAPLDNFHY